MDDAAFIEHRTNQLHDLLFLIDSASCGRSGDAGGS
jgi:hypothetical protein